MAQIRQTASMTAFQAASAIDPSVLRETIASLTVIAILAWSAHYLRRVMAHGWDRTDLMHIGSGLFLVLVLAFFVFWVLANIGADI